MIVNQERTIFLVHAQRHVSVFSGLFPTFVRLSPMAHPSLKGQIPFSPTLPPPALSGGRVGESTVTVQENTLCAQIVPRISAATRMGAA